MLCGDLSGKEMQKRGDVCMRMIDWLCSIIENGSTLESNYMPIKIKKKIKKKYELALQIELQGKYPASSFWPDCSFETPSRNSGATTVCLWTSPPWAFLMAQWVKNLSAMQETQEMEASIPGSGRSPGGEGMTTRSNTLAWKIPWIEKPGGL